MAMLDEKFVTEDLPVDEFNNDPVPEGVYQCRITKAEYGPGKKDPNSRKIELNLKITGPTHIGRVVFANLNVRNESAKAEQIGRSQLRSLLAACGMSELSDTDHLIDQLVSCKVKIKEAEGQYSAKNDVTGYAAVTESQPTAPKPSASTAPTGSSSAAPASGKKMPWDKK